MRGVARDELNPTGDRERRMCNSMLFLYSAPVPRIGTPTILVQPRSPEPTCMGGEKGVRCIAGGLPSSPRPSPMSFGLARSPCGERFATLWEQPMVSGLHSVPELAQLLVTPAIVPAVENPAIDM